MSETEASIGYGSALEIARASAPTDFTHIRETTDGTPPSVTDDNHEASHSQSPNRFKEYISGMSDGGEASFEMNYVPGSATDRFLLGLRGVKLVARYTFASGVQVIFDCLRQSYEANDPVNDKRTATLGLKVTGEPYMSASPVAPRNLVAPSISGTAQVGQLLTVDNGEWAGATSFTYQWQGDTGGNGTFANIAGQTGQSMVVPVSQQGDDVRCVVTGVNTAYSTAANSPETASVAAA
jgi:hypothetical protein